MTGRAAHKSTIFGHFKDMLPTLCRAFPDYRIVLRPHPSENHAPWEQVARDHANMHVANEGSVTPWLMAAKALVANGCTTEVEAAILGVPAVSFQPVRSETFDDPLPAAVSQAAFDLDHLVAAVRDAVHGGLAPARNSERNNRLRPHIAALDGALAGDRIIDVLEQSGYARRQPPGVGPRRFAAGWVRTKCRSTVKRINMIRPGHRNNIRYHAHRFPGISVAEIRQRISRLSQLLGRFEDVRVEKISRHVFRLSR